MLIVGDVQVTLAILSIVGLVSAALVAGVFQVIAARAEPRARRTRNDVQGLASEVNSALALVTQMLKDQRARDDAHKKEITEKDWRIRDLERALARERRKHGA